MIALSSQRGLDPQARAVYRRALKALRAADIPFLLGGAYAYFHYTGIARHTKDLDVFVRPEDVERTLAALAADGFRTEITSPVWLAKAFAGDLFIDIIFSSGNGLARVDDEWFRHAVAAEVLGMPVRLVPVEEMIWSKAFIMERDRFDGADIAHLLQAHAENLDWERLRRRFGEHWHVLYIHLVMFGYIYPCERHRIPRAVMHELHDELRHEVNERAPADRRCRGMLLAKSQYAVDVEEWGYDEAHQPVWLLGPRSWKS